MNAGTRPARRRTAVFGAIAVTATLLTSACAAGRVAQTIRQTPAIDGVNAQTGSVAVRYLSIVAPTGDSYPKGSAVRLTGVFANSGTSADQLVDISTSSFTGWGAYSSVAAAQQALTSSSAAKAAGASRSVAVPAGGRASFGVPEATGALLLLGSTAPLYPGTQIRVTLTFAKAGEISVNVPVQISDTPGTSTIPAPSGSGAESAG